MQVETFDACCLRQLQYGLRGIAEAMWNQALVEKYPELLALILEKASKHNQQMHESQVGAGDPTQGEEEMTEN